MSASSSFVAGDGDDDEELLDELTDGPAARLLFRISLAFALADPAALPFRVPPKVTKITITG